MDKVSFQNGFICGMATKGLVRSGELYKPLISNDSGFYTYFYIDFRRGMQAFSTGMFNESVVVHDSIQLAVTDIKYVSVGKYKIYCDIANRTHGITVLNKKTSRLKFSSGEQLPVFSTHMYIAGQDAYIDGGYAYDSTQFYNVRGLFAGNSIESVETSLADITDLSGTSETCVFSVYRLINTVETPGVILT